MEFLVRYNIQIDLVGELLKTKTVKQAALHLKIPYNSLYNFCKRNELKSSIPSKGGRKNESDKHIDAVVKMYLAGDSQMQIAKALGICQVTVHNIIKKTAHHMRTKSEAARLRDAKKTDSELQQRAAAANAVRIAMGIMNRFS